MGRDPESGAIRSRQRQRCARALCFAWASLGCSAESGKPVVAAAKPPPVVAPAAPPKPAPDPNRLESELGAELIAALTGAEHAWFADLRVISAAVAERPAALNDRTRIRGYPALRPLRPLSIDAARQIASILIDRRSYQVGERRRCRIERLLGLRFKKQDIVVDLALGSPCGSVFWSSAWAEPLRDDAAKRVFARVPSVR